jgi:hypothetical protein
VSGRLWLPRRYPFIQPVADGFADFHATRTARDAKACATFCACDRHGAAGLGMVLLLGAGALWFHYGTAMFFEMIASGISACF